MRPEVRDFVRFLNSNLKATMEEVDDRIRMRIHDHLTEKPIENMITDAMISNIVQRVYDMLNPMVNEELTRLAQNARSTALAHRELEGEQWSTILRRLADTLDDKPKA